MFSLRVNRFVASIAAISSASIRLSGGTSVKASQTGFPDLTGEPVEPLLVPFHPPKSSVKSPYEIPANDQQNYEVLPPKARKIPLITRLPWDTLVDNYSWLREESNPDTISYLNAENAYTDYKMKHTEALQQQLYNEMLSRIVEDDSTVPAKLDEYYYYTRTEAGKAYKIHCRKKGIDGKEEVLLDENKMAEKESFLNIGDLEVSPNHEILAYSIDTKGNEVYTMRFQDIKTGKFFTDEIQNVDSDIVWAKDNKTIFYLKYDEAWRPYQVWKHVLGEKNSSDELVMEEKDSKFRLSVKRSRSGEYIFINAGSAVTDEIWYLKMNNVKGNSKQALKCLAKREQDVEYIVDHHENEFLILTNKDNATNFKLMSTPCDNPTTWKEVIPHSENVTLSHFRPFKDFIIIEQRSDGLPQLRVRYKNASNVEGEHLIKMPEDSYSVEASKNLEYNSKFFRIAYTSMVTPWTTFDYDVMKKELITLKVKPINHYDASQYKTSRVFATARDGTPVPITLLMRKTVTFPAPFVLHGYGSYGSSEDPYFSSNRLSLVDRGVIFGLAHIRGGGEYGRKWKLSGKLQHKRNTFTDFIACSEHVINTGLTNSKLLQVSGRSAGGLLMGSVANMRPDLYHAIIADVPFVDVINTVLDESIPLTAGEWEEWGDPRTVRDYWTIKSYSPYDNIKPMAYPHILLQGSLQDTRVKYWEPAKFCAKLRDVKLNDGHDLLLKIIMSGGHSGSSGRYAQLKEMAFEYAFVLDKANLLNSKNDLIPSKNETNQKTTQTKQ